MSGVVERVGDREPGRVAGGVEERRVRRVLLIVNRTSGVGHGSSVVDGLRAVIDGSLDGRAGVRAVSVGGHAEARSVAALRMGSGNPLARRFGVPADPEAGLRGILENLRAGRTAPCCVMRCEAGLPGGGSRTHYAATMAGFGQFGRVPGDVESLRRRWPKLRKVASGLFGVERTNHAEYLLACLSRAARCVIRSDAAVETVEVRSRGRAERMSLLAGVALNFPLSEVPANPGVSVEDEVVSLYFIPWVSRASALRMLLAPRRAFREAVRFRLEGLERVELSLVNGGPSECFLDEDPVSFHDRLSLEVAGSLTFVPGPDYGFDPESEVVS